MTEVTLEPCPLCNGHAVMWEDGDPKYPWCVTFEHADDCPLYAVPTDFFRSYPTEAEAAAAWNDRASSAVVDTLREAEATCAHLLAEYLRKEIGRLMQQAEHWAANGAPLAVHHRVNKADAYYQILVLMERDPLKGWNLPFDEIRDELARPPIKPAGAYPPSAGLHRYRDPRFAVAALANTPKPNAGLVEEA